MRQAKTARQKGSSHHRTVTCSYLISERTSGCLSTFWPTSASQPYEGDFVDPFWIPLTHDRPVEILGNLSQPRTYFEARRPPMRIISIGSRGHISIREPRPARHDLAPTPLVRLNSGGCIAQYAEINIEHHNDLHLTHGIRQQSPSYMSCELVDTVAFLRILFNTNG